MEEQQAEEEQAEEQQAEGQMEVDAEEEARADAELAALQAAEPMIDGVKTGGPSFSAGTIRFRKTVSIRPRCNPADRSVIVPVGDRSWREVGWTGERYRLDGEGDYEKEKMAKRVFNKAATKVVRDFFRNARSDFQGASDRNRGNRTSKPGKQRFGADGFIGKEQRMEAKMGTKPSFVDVWIEGHKGLDPENLEILCDEQATEKLAKYKENVIQRYGPEFDWRAGAPDVEAIYDASGGLRHGRWGLGDGSLEYDRISRPPRTNQGSSSRRSSRAQQEAQQEKTRRLQEETFRLRQNNDYMMTYLVTLSQKLGGDVTEFRPSQSSPQVPSNYFSSPINQGTPLGDAQGWLGSNAPEFRPPQLFPQVPPNYFTTPTS
ncbi:hypothetical protein U9M48_016244 [Paspalum notatum var. saurae]|uniref:Uncharacterized protein n=1 Tax=Paspalum notatum var. saurae TaxID=547442 RepID=A0AAQ3T894_PASNO